jgi:hypothetical protein
MTKWFLPKPDPEVGFCSEQSLCKLAVRCSRSRPIASLELLANRSHGGSIGERASEALHGDVSNAHGRRHLQAVAGGSRLDSVDSIASSWMAA